MLLSPKWFHIVWLFFATLFMSLVFFHNWKVAIVAKFYAAVKSLVYFLEFT